jgi:hypothetical protein
MGAHNLYGRRKLAPVVAQVMRIGPTASEFKRALARGACAECGGECSPECGAHPLGCHWGGSPNGYWIIADGCKLDHGE